VATTTIALGVEIDVYNLHGEAGNTPLDQQFRAADFEQLAELIAIRSAGRAVIVETFRRDDGEPLSDHDPLAVTFAWTGRAGGGSTPGDGGGGPRPVASGAAPPAHPVIAVPRFTA
jgi:hypothetical protein